MLKSAIEKIESMVEPSVYEKDGHSFLINRDGEFAEIREEIDKHFKFREVIETIASCTVTSHCGKGTIGILYLNDGIR